MSKDKKPNWMNEEDDRAKDLAEAGETTNNTAPKLVKVERAPERKQKSFYVQPAYTEAF